MIDDKQIVIFGLLKQYYCVVEINRKKLGVITNKKIFNMNMYQKYSTYHYRLYTYINGDKSIAYLFSRPEFKKRKGKLSVT